MKKYRTGSKNKKYKSERIGFFTAFSVCIIAISLGLWSTYLSIGGLDGNTEEETKSTYSATNSANNEAVDSDVRGIIVNGRSDGSSGSDADPVEGGEGGESAEGFESSADAQSVTDSVSSSDAKDADVPDTGASSSTEDKLQTILQIRTSLLYPVSSQRITKEYSEQTVFSKTMNDYRSHTGVDFQAHKGEAVFAAGEGIVEEIYGDDMYGTVIKITDGPYSIYYCGLGDDIPVKEGDYVEAGQVIAQIGLIPCESKDEDHLHMEVRVNDQYIDPMTVISNDE